MQKIKLDDYSDEEFKLHRRRRSEPETKQLTTDLQQRIQYVSELPNLSVGSNKQQSILIILFVISLFVGFAPRLIKRLKAGTAKGRAARAAMFSDSINKREREIAPELQRDMQRAYDQMEEYTKATVRAITSGQIPELKPQVKFKIREDSV